MKTFINYLNENKIQPIIKTDKTGKYWVIPNTEKHKLSYKGLGILHREDGPAIEYDDGTKYWLINGKMHREDGPAIAFNNLGIFWYLDDKEIEPTNEMMEKYIRLNPDNIFKKWDWPKEIQELAIELGGERIRVKLMVDDKLDPSLMDEKFNDLNKRGFFN